MPKKYDLTIAYRIYPKISKNPIVFNKDKYKLSELCLRSLKKSLGDLKVKMIVLLDNCPSEYSDLFKRYFDPDDLELIHLEGVGNLKTFSMQIEILLDQKFSDVVYFAEDDYYYLPNQFSEMINFLIKSDDVDFVSPFDHIDYYKYNFHNYNSKIKFCEKKHWRTVATTCLTFLTTKETLKNTQNIFKSYTRGNYDTSIWASLTKYNIFNPFKLLRYQEKPYFIGVFFKSWRYSVIQNFFGKRWSLWTPIPTIATHVETEDVSPTLEWSKIIEEKQ
ncbi:glycosyltransferase family 2 protein [Methanobacterium formicicum]|uniref:Glycosyltransferase family 2 protein n=1 Tax=Methanobacterium formicicum TaxID=2162 RepID=A0A843AKM9_METFO|nr:glycosyltransferase family 2 protein [Methanobacterium formicicum]MBF4474376.1 glycosyltransferase family 2 protein [Methanobacterium formicicum]